MDTLARVEELLASEQVDAENCGENGEREYSQRSIGIRRRR